MATVCNERNNNKARAGLRPKQRRFDFQLDLFQLKTLPFEVIVTILNDFYLRMLQHGCHNLA